MYYKQDTLIPVIPAVEYDDVATDFLETYFREGLMKPQAIPIEKIATEEMGLNIQYVRLSEELDVFGLTVFTDGVIEIYNEEDGLYEEREYKRKTVLIDPEAYKKTNAGCVHNTIAHECVHWFKHRMYYKMQQYTLPRHAKYCKCRVEDLPYETEEEELMENHAIGIAPRILMPKGPFLEMASKLEIKYGADNRDDIARLAEFFDVSKQSATIRLKECGLI